MKHLRLFATEAEFEAEKVNIPKPWIAFVNDVKKVYFMGNRKPSIPNNEIWYTTSNGNILELPERWSGAELQSNTYFKGKGVMVFSDDVTSIGSSAFYSCSSLTSINIPKSLTGIGPDAFYGCSSLSSITYGGTISQWKAILKADKWNFSVPATEVTCSDGTTAL